MSSIEQRIKDAEKKKIDAELKLELATKGGKLDRIKDAQYEHIGSIDNLQRLLYKQRKQQETDARK